MISLIVLFLASMTATCISTNLALYFTRSAIRPARVGQPGISAKRMSFKYAAGSFAILAAVAFGGVCTSLIQIFSA